MKKIFPLMIIALLTMGKAWGQNKTQDVDSAQLIVDHYLDLLNYDAIKTDSALYIESAIVHRKTPKDTITLKRWFVAPYSYRIEMWHEGKLIYGLVTDGRTIHKRLAEGDSVWREISLSKFVDDFTGYDFHGPFSHYKVLAWDAEYHGTWKMNGHEVYRIFVQDPQRNDRDYLFEKESGLLFLVDEKWTKPENVNAHDTSHVDWRAYHEYTPLGRCLFPTVESYQFEDDITMIFSKVMYVEKDEKLYQ